MLSRTSLGPAVMALLAAAATAEVPDLSRDDLNHLATHVVTGQVQRIYTNVETGGGYEFTHGLAEISITGLEKGDGLKVGGLVYARFWGKRWIGQGEPPPDAYGHGGVPAKGAGVRVYLERAKDGGYDVLLPNGFEPLGTSSPHRRRGAGSSPRPHP